MKKWIMALDQGTTSSRAILFDKSGKARANVAQEFTQYFPQPGWVEHDPWDIWNTTKYCMQEALKQAKVKPEDLVAIGITNQRETALVWDRRTGKPVYNAIVWQCRRTADYCIQLQEEGWNEILRRKTGLMADAYFTATKVAWILDNVPGARRRAEQGYLMMGTVDSWLMYNLTGGKVHATDYTNASRTQLFNIHSQEWDPTLLKLFRIPESMLPKAQPSGSFFGMTDPELLGCEVPIQGVAGDQQAALFGQACFKAGSVKNTYGTGCFLLMNTGARAVQSKSGLLTTLAATVEGAPVQYALEGSVFTGGASIQWLRDQLGLISSASQSEELALSVPDTGGVYLVPAFTGLGTPWWNMFARGTLFGMTRGTNRAHLVRAALESIAFQSRDVLDVMVKDAGYPITSLKVDGGASANSFLMQFQADILQRPVERPAEVQTTALGAAYLAGLSSGLYKSQDEIAENWTLEHNFQPIMDKDESQKRYQGWQHAVRQAIAYTKQP